MEGGVYHLANSSLLQKKLQFHKICTHAPPPPPNIHFHLPSSSFYLFPFTFQENIYILGGGGGGGEFKPPGQLNSSPLKKFTIPPSNIHFHLLFLSKFFAFTLKKTSFFLGGRGSLPPGQLISSQTKIAIL